MKHLIIKTFSTCASCFFWMCTLHGQEKYISFSSGYSFKAGSVNAVNFNNTSMGNNAITYEQINLSLGRGLNVCGAFGMYFNKNVGLDFGINYLLGSKTTATDEYIGGKTELTYSGNMLRLNPSLVFRAESNKLKPYARFGVIVGKGSINAQYKDVDEGDILLLKLKLNGGLAFGFSSAMGINYMLNEKISLFGEINAVNMSYAPSRGKVTEASFNGVDALPNMTTSEKEFEYVNSYTETFNSTPPDSEPTKSLKEKFPFGSIGLNIGMKISLQ